jgi:PAS domain S-box-containing protein
MPTDPKTILLVEDEAIIAIEKKMTLQRYGYKVVLAHSGEAAIQEVCTNPETSLILMDINLGSGIDGTEAAKAILAERDIPVVFHSSHTEPEVVEKTEGITSYGYIVKSSGETVLIASIKMAYRLFEAKRALTHSRDLMRYVIEHNRSAVAVHDRDLNYVYVSNKYIEDYNIKDLDIIGKHHYKVFPDLPQRWREVHQRALAGEVSSAEDDIYERDDGSTEWTRWECRPWYEADKSIGGIIVYTEVITPRKMAELAFRQSEEKYRAIIQALQEGFWVVSVDGSLTDVNAAYSSMSGYSKEELLSMSICDIEALDNESEIKRRTARIIDSGFEHFESRHRRKDGSIFDVDVSVYYLDNEFICFCRDVTSVRRTEP